MDPAMMRGIERIVAAFGGIFFAYLGYRLYAIGVKNGRVSANADLSFARIALAGAGPGLGFMIVGGAVLLLSLYHGSVSTDFDESGKTRSVQVRRPERDTTYDGPKDSDPTGTPYLSPPPQQDQE